MLFTRIASFFAFALTLGILAVAKPVGLDKRVSNAAVDTVITTLKSKTDTIVPQIQSAGSNSQVSEATVAPLITELVTAFNTAQLSLAEAQLGRLGKRQSADDIAALFAGIVSDVAIALTDLPTELAGLPILLVSLDVAISELIVGLNTVVVGLGVLVGGLVLDVGGLLASLGLGLTLGLLGL